MRGVPDRDALPVEPGVNEHGRWLIAHRGASAVEAENTLDAFEAAIDAGADAVEFDVRMTADGAAVVMHDSDVGRTTGGRGLVRDLTLDEVKGLRIRTTGDTAEVPTLTEALRCCSGRAGVDVEIKNLPGEPDFEPERQLAVEATLSALDEVSFSGSVVLSSFNPLAVAHARRLAPDVLTGLLTDVDVDPAATIAYAAAEGHAWALPFIGGVLDSAEQVASEAREAGVLLGVWITDVPAEAVRLWTAGVDAVATNDPRSLAAARTAAFGE
jgi:glycerophosphoryl diester phosphodiesterase